MAKRRKKSVKAYPVWFLIILLIIGAVGAVIWYIYVYKPNHENNNNNNTNQSQIAQGSNNNQPIELDGDIQIYSIEMRDEYGDALFIKYKDYDILIDAGNYGDGEFVQQFVDNHISSDKNLDLLIVTHCHADHMGGLAKSGKNDNSPKALDNVSTISNILDFGHSRSNYALYNNYVTLRESYINKGAKYYSAHEAAKKLNGLDNKIIFEDLTIDILDTNTYQATGNDIVGSDDYNEYSIATLISYKDTKLFCAGDLEDAGEANLIANKDNTVLKDLKESDKLIYKACHHGTDVGTANNKSTGYKSTNGGNRMALLKILNPDYCFISSAITKSDHPFPRALATMLYFTEYVYFNGTMGTICFDIDGENVGVKGLGVTTNYTLTGFEINYDTEKNLKYTDTAWYNNKIFEGSKNWYNGDIENPTIKDLTEWYLNKLKNDYGG